MKKLLLLFSLAASTFAAQAQNQYLITFKDKGPEAAYFRQHPEKILSEKSLARRQKHGVWLKKEDLPVSQTYLKQLQQNGIEIQQKSKWLNAAFIQTPLDAESLRKQFPAISQVKSYGPANGKTAPEKFPAKKDQSENNRLNYGASDAQISQLNLDCLHDKGYQGKGVLIAVFDTGFPGVNTVAAYDSLRTQNRILATRNFVNKSSTVFGSYLHGSLVLSVMAANAPNNYVGGAARANYALAITENMASETHQEELNWAAAAEWADSLGADIIQSSLSYKYFDPGQVDYTDSDLDGNTAIITRAADKAAQKGILVINSAGNNGTFSAPLSNKISPPCDGDSVLCVGSVTITNQYSNFSSVGPTANNRIKPDVTARGSAATLVMPDGSISADNGTSLSTPLISAVAACLFQANPAATNMQVYQAIIRSADKFNNPNNQFGYGLPNACKADSLLKKILALPKPANHQPVKVYPTIFQDKITIEQPVTGLFTSASLYSVTGQLITRQTAESATNLILRPHINLPKGLYLLRLENQEGQLRQFKLVKE